MSRTYDDPEQYNGWTNRETWAVALYINNDQGWQESVLESLRAAQSEYDNDGYDDGDRLDGITAYSAGAVIQSNVEGVLSDLLDVVQDSGTTGVNRRGLYESVRDDLGSLWRVDWTELGAAFLSDLEGQS